MKIYFKIMGSLTSLLITFFLIHMIGCSDQGSVTSFEQDKSTSISDYEDILSKRANVRELSAALDYSEQSIYPQSGSCITHFKKSRNIYSGNAFQLPNKSSFSFSNGALTPPLDHPWGEPVIITMMAEKDFSTNEIIFTFGPSGCKFETPAEVWFNWADLGIDNAKLYYLDSDGNRIEELPEQIDICNKQMSIRITHFSRYSLAYSN